METTTQETTNVAQVVQLDPAQVEGFSNMLNLSAGLLGFVIILLGGLLLIEIHRG